MTNKYVVTKNCGLFNKGEIIDVINLNGIYSKVIKDGEYIVSNNDIYGHIIKLEEHRNKTINSILRGHE